MKELYKFTVRENVEDGEPIMHQVLVAKPNRRQVEEADMEYSITLSKCISDGILTKQMLAKKYSDAGGIMSEYDAKQLLEHYVKADEISNKIARIKSIGGKNKENTKKVEKLSTELAEIRREIVETETNYQTLFNHTADIKAQNAVIRWYVLNLLHRYDGDEEDYASYFSGDYDNRKEAYYKKEDEEDETHAKIMAKAASIVSLWFFNDVETPKEIDDLFEKIGFDIDQEDADPEDAEEEEEKKPVAKKVAKKTPRKTARKAVKKTTKDTDE